MQNNDYENYLLKKCAKCGVWTKDRYCFDCKPKANAERHAKYDRDKRRAESRAFYNSVYWRKLSAKQRKDFPYCQWKYEDGTICGSTYRLCADHIIPRDQGGPDKQSNLQTLCQPHHNLKTGQETGSFLGRPQVTVVCGPPGSGKTTYVLARAKPLDLIFDLDRLLSALSLCESHVKPEYMLKTAWEARDAMYAFLERSRNIPRAWIIEGAPTPERRMMLRDRFKAEIVVLLPTREQCLERIAKAENRDQSASWASYVDAWYKAYLPCSLDIVIS